MIALDELRALIDPDGSLRDVFQGLATDHEAAPPWLTITCSACPTQAEGRLKDGCLWYFRARHGEWRIDVGEEPGSNPIGNTECEGDDPTGGWMPLADIVRILDEHLGSRIDKGGNE